MDQIYIHSKNDFEEWKTWIKARMSSFYAYNWDEVFPREPRGFPVTVVWTILNTEYCNELLYTFVY